MKLASIWQIAAAWLAVSTPWIVVTIVKALAPSEAAVTAKAAGRRLVAGTLVALVAMTAIGATGAPPSLIAGGAALAMFAVLSVLAWPLLAEVDRRSREGRDIEDTSRVASLRPRHVSQYLSPWLQAIPVLVAGLATMLMILRLWTPEASGERRLIPMAFIVGAVVFHLLYGRWIAQEVSGAQVADPMPSESERRHRVRSIYAWQITLVVGFAALGHLLLTVDWTHDAPLAMFGNLAGGVLGVIGCARALTSDLHSRRYRPVTPGSAGPRVR